MVSEVGLQNPKVKINKMKLTELRVDRLKRELGKLELPTTGTKNELQRRLREQLQLQGIDIESYEFEDEEERELQAPASSSGVDINSLLASMMEKMQVANQMLLTEVQEASRTENQKLIEASRAENQKMKEASRAENQKLLTDVRKTSRAENPKLLIESRRDSEQRMERMQTGVLSKIEKELEATSGMLLEIHDSVSRRITGGRERVSHLEKTVDTKVDNLEKAVEGNS